MKPLIDVPMGFRFPEVYKIDGDIANPDTVRNQVENRESDD